MCSKSYQKQEIKRSGSSILKLFIGNTFNKKRVCIIIRDLTLFGTIPSNIHQVDWYCLGTYF